MKIKRPPFHQEKESCILCKEHFDKKMVEFGPDWFKYMCKECFEEHAKRWGFEILE